MRPPAPARAADLSLTRYVNPFIGTSPDAPDYGINNAAGDTFPGAVTPNGMAQFSPDTTTDPGGYRYNQNTINAFSLTHFSGRGVACWEDIGLMPTAGPLGVSPGVSWSAYASTFTHGNESASPGSYHVQLDKYGIGADLTVTPRTGFARFTYPVSPTATLLLNAGHSAQGNDDAGPAWPSSAITRSRGRPKAATAAAPSPTRSTSPPTSTARSRPRGRGTAGP